MTDFRFLQLSGPLAGEFGTVKAPGIRCLIGLLTLLTAACGGQQSDYSSGDEESFLSLVRTYQLLDNLDDDQVIATAHGVCDRFSEGEKKSKVLWYVGNADGTGNTSSDAAFNFMNLATLEFCPELRGEIDW